MIRSYIEIPLGDPPIWKFQTHPTVSLSHSEAQIKIRRSYKKKKSVILTNDND